MPPRKEEVTLKDIAEAVGKSVAAVSRALNNHDDISEETREHIKQVAREMGYAPTNTLGLIMPALPPRDSEPYYSELLAMVAVRDTGACAAMLRGQWKVSVTVCTRAAPATALAACAGRATRTTLSPPLPAAFCFSETSTTTASVAIS